MPTPVTQWPPEIEAKFAKLAREGLSARKIATSLKAMGAEGASVATVGRRLRERLGPRRSGKTVESAPVAVPKVQKSAPVPPVPPASDGAPGDLPDEPAELDASPAEQLDWWLVQVRAAFERAKIGDNVAAQASLSARATALLEAKRKGSPPAVADPNEALDIKAAAERGKRLMFETLENLIANRALLARVRT